MSVKVMTAVWERSRARGHSLLLLIAIADNAGDDGVAWPSIRHLAGKTRMSEDATRDALKRLQESGELDITVGGGRQSNRYRVTLAGATPGENTRGSRIQGTPGSCIQLNHHITVTGGKPPPDEGEDEESGSPVAGYQGLPEPTNSPRQLTEAQRPRDNGSSISSSTIIAEDSS